MSQRKDPWVLDILVRYPWWVSVLVSLAMYGFLAYLLPWISFSNPILQGIANGVSTGAGIIALALLPPAMVGPIIRHRKRKLLATQQGLQSIRALSWRQFEVLIAEIFRRKGYQVLENEHEGPDGGIDIRLRKDGDLHLVQCKHWKKYKVGVAIIREMYGVMVAEQAVSMTVVTSGMFTHDAVDFAADKPIDLIDGVALNKWMKEAQGVVAKTEAPTTSSEPNNGKLEQATLMSGDSPEAQAGQPCPKCGADLVLRTATKGTYEGKKFFGCSAFPSCRYIQNIVQ